MERGRLDAERRFTPGLRRGRLRSGHAVRCSHLPTGPGSASDVVAPGVRRPALRRVPCPAGCRPPCCPRPWGTCVARGAANKRALRAPGPRAAPALPPAEHRRLCRRQRLSWRRVANCYPRPAQWSRTPRLLREGGGRHLRRAGRARVGPKALGEPAAPQQRPQRPRGAPAQRIPVVQVHIPANIRGRPHS